MLWTQSFSGACTHIPCCTCFVAVRPTLEWTCRNSRKKATKKKKKSCALFSRCSWGYSPGLNATFEIWAFPYKLGGSHCRFEKLWCTEWQVTPQQTDLFDLRYGPLSFFLLYCHLCPPPTHSTSNPTQSKCFLLLWCWYTIVEEEHQNISHHRQGWHWQWTKTNWGEMIMGTDFFGNWCDRLHYWVNRSMKHSRLAWNEKL